MSFRTRLGLFFLLMVAIPIAAIAVLASDVSGDSQAGKADAQLATGLQTAIALFEESQALADRALNNALNDSEFSAALNSGNTQEISTAGASAGKAAGLEYLRTTAVGGVTPLRGDSPIATATVLVDTSGGQVQVTGAVTNASDYASRIEDLTGLQVAVSGEQIDISGVDASDLPEPGDTTDAEIDGGKARAATASLGDDGAAVTLLARVESGEFLDSRPLIAVIVAIFLAIALMGVAVVARTMQSQIAAMLDAARRIGSGDFSRRIPVVGRDEMAGLAGEFNKMTDQLEAQISELRRQRTELDRSVTRLGEAFASGLDRDSLLTIVAETAIGACDAEYARFKLADGQVIESPEGFTGPAREAVIAGQKRVESEGSNVDVRHNERFALAAPLKRMSDGKVRGSLSIGRSNTAFSDSDREVFLYLIGQASASIENIHAHERVSEQAVTDELTGLPNNRAFRETIDREASRAERFDHELSLVILDVDNFKSVNDTYGHLQGDEVLRAIGKILSEEPRAIDEPARYGGEEFVVALPETGVDGAVELAERIRERLEATEIPLLDGSGQLKVTASFGTATVPLSATTVRQLFAAADDALYEAKRAGKNRVVTAPDRVPAHK